MKIRFLLDENLSPKLKFAVLRLNPAIDIVRVGDPDAPPLGTLDPELLRYLEVSERLLVTYQKFYEFFLIRMYTIIKLSLVKL
ncbi:MULTISPECIES: DUF5615 family PIN-like protein [Dolichospermum]|jgi:hypothetical protein|uniref:Uncharacterized protein n=1 Tax=Dolichospermum compactum NIES-806 TaxID=1973481 RepID=A0A1Z4V5M5_9CYAN|nr:MULTISPECIES: DUF5615 family PIN-like protein [Dolichospermum]MDM3859998.1 DUF5615 family PIN-like protein [Aphanizomenon gracile PMC644.10]MTJ17835.1 hypothetical protein [Dolichospermum sp. UHCC 0299]MTJ41238.1 hypothetical protein [Dolichospermum sp. UHCC 0406]BAZ86846.1 hypothetical protein NIES806_30630 [Dolichospermum compactum NIES-806]